MLKLDRIYKRFLAYLRRIAGDRGRVDRQELPGQLSPSALSITGVVNGCHYTGIPSHVVLMQEIGDLDDPSIYQLMEAGRWDMD